MVEIKKILFPCDFTENSIKIIPYVLSLSEKYNSMIYILHVVDDLSKWGGFFIPHLSMDMFQNEAVKGAEKMMEKIYNEHLQDCPDSQKKIITGDPALEIIKTVESEEIDLVIMGTHGRKGLEHIILGSVAEHIVKKSPVPVLTINPHKLPAKK